MLFRSTVTQSFGTRSFCNPINRIDVSKYESLASVSVKDGSTLAAGTYAINSLDDLKRLRDLTNNGQISSANTFIMGADIDMSSVSNWNPIGRSAECAFKGSFNGNGYEIQNLNIDLINGVYDSSGLFGYMYGDVKFLGISGANVRSDQRNIGILAGVVDGSKTINNCYVQGNIEQIGNRSDTFVGGMIGKMNSGCVIKYSHADITLRDTIGTSYDKSLGGLVGQVRGSITIQNSYAKGVLEQTTGNGNVNMGGLVGSNSDAAHGCVSIISCFTDMAISGNGYMGGLFGNIIGSSGYWTNTVWISDTNVGGSIQNYKQDKYSFYAGGVVGRLCGDYDGENDSYDRAYVSFINSSTDVDITLDSTYTSTGRYYAGGFIAYQEANEDNSNYGYISIEGSSFNGSINLKAAKGGSLYAGGTAGYSTAGISVKNSRMNMTISAIANSQSESKVCAGGMFGYYSITTGTTQSISCLIEGSVSANAERGTVYAGGTSGYSAGECYYSTYSQDYTTYNVYYTSIISSASVSAESAGGNAYAGGFIGDADYYIEAKVIQTSGNVTATARHYDRSYGTYGGSAYAGGTIGYCSYLNSNSSIITSFTSSGSINATGTKCGAAGGLFGYASISKIGRAS